jgi:high-affinity nickel-transport protein
MYILYKLIQQMRRLIDTRMGEEEEFTIQGSGCLFQVFKKLFKLVDR